MVAAFLDSWPPSTAVAKVRDDIVPLNCPISEAFQASDVNQAYKVRRFDVIGSPNRYRTLDLLVNSYVFETLCLRMFARRTEPEEAGPPFTHRR